MKKDLNYYLSLPWTYIFEWSDEDNCYIVSIVELDGLKTDGETIKEATAMIEDALIEYIETKLEFGDEINEPPKPENYKGKIAYRTSPKTHYKIAKRAAAERKSISKLIDELVEKGLAS